MIRYEWTVETLEEDDIVESEFADNYEQALRIAANPLADYSVRIGIVRDRYDCYEDLVCRSWAYIESGKLPEYFVDGRGVETTKVPRRFHKQVAA